MGKTLWVVIVVFICIQMAGCSGWAIRTSTSTKPRVDQEVSGNRGFISGKAASAPKEPTFTERKVYQIEIEMPHRPFLQRPKKDEVIWGNKGYISGSAGEEKASEEVVVKPPAVEAPVTKSPEWKK